MAAANEIIDINIINIINVDAERLVFYIEDLKEIWQGGKNATNLRRLKYK